MPRTMTIVKIGEFAGRLEARMDDGEVIGVYNGSKRICTVGVKGDVTTFDGFYMLSEMSWRAKVRFIADRLNSQSYWGKDK